MLDLTEMTHSMNLSELMDTIKSNYLYIVGVLVVLLVAVAYFYYLKMNKSNNLIDNGLIDNSGPNMECDGEKCFVKESQPIYDKCDGDYVEHNENKSVF